MSIKFCPNCQRNVNTEHSWSTGALIVLLLFLFPIGLIYLAFRWKRRCPICHTPNGFLTAPYFAQPPQQGRYP